MQICFWKRKKKIDLHI